MTYVVTAACIKCKYTDCADICPVACFHEGPDFLVIDPLECIDCAACEPVCPVEAIYLDDKVPSDQKEFALLNSELSKQWPVIRSKKAPPTDADQWAGRPGKRALLEV
jgi:ferredoxin